MNLKELLKKKSFRIVYFILSPLLSVILILGWVDFVRTTHARGVADDFNAAVKQLQDSPPGTERADVFLKRLKAIDTSYAPAEVKQALTNYISAIEQGLNATKTGQNTDKYDREIAEAKQKLVAAVKKWE
jgi:hypothetical protein